MPSKRFSREQYGHQMAAIATTRLDMCLIPQQIAEMTTSHCKKINIREIKKGQETTLLTHATIWKTGCNLANLPLVFSAFLSSALRVSFSRTKRIITAMMAKRTRTRWVDLCSSPGCSGGLALRCYSEGRQHGRQGISGQTPPLSS